MKGKNCNHQILQEIRFLLVELGLTSSQVHSALAYYFDHQEEIDKDVATSFDEEYWKRQVQSHPKLGITK